MLVLTPQFLVSTVTTLVPWEQQRKTSDGKRRGARIDAKRAAASLRFVQFVGFWSHYAPGRHYSSWPLPSSIDIEELPAFAARERGLAERPEAGDVFLLAPVGGAGPHTLSGIVLEVETVRTMMNGRDAFVCLTAEGEIAGSASSPRIANVRLVRRRLSEVFGDCFIRWCDLPPRLSAAGAAEGTVARYQIPDDMLTLKRNRRRAA